MFVCPVCQRQDITVYGEQNTARCANCGTFDALHKFEAAIISTGSDFDPRAIFPPDEIVECVAKLRNYFVRDRGAKQWAFGHVQSRDEPAVLGIEHIRNMAQAFRMEVIARPQATDFISKMRRWLADADFHYGLSKEDSSADKAELVCARVSEYLFPARPEKG